MSIYKESGHGVYHERYKDRLRSFGRRRREQYEEREVREPVMNTKSQHVNVGKYF